MAEPSWWGQAQTGTHVGPGPCISCFGELFFSIHTHRQVKQDAMRSSETQAYEVVLVRKSFLLDLRVCFTSLSWQNIGNMSLGDSCQTQHVFWALSYQRSCLFLGCSTCFHGSATFLLQHPRAAVNFTLCSAAYPGHLIPPQSSGES